MKMLAPARETRCSFVIPPAKCERIVVRVLARLRGKCKGCAFRCKVQVGRVFPADNPVVHMRQTGIIQYVEW